MSSLFDGRNQLEVGIDPPRRGGVSGHDSTSELVHVHVCVCCGHARRREEITGREMGSGILHCPNCESNGPLNVEIRGTDD